MPARPKARIASSKPKSVRTLIIAVVYVAVLGFGALLIMHTVFKPKSQRKLLQTALAEQFNSVAEAIVPNVPSRSGRYPGAVLAVSLKGSELLVRRMDRPEKVPAPSGSLKGAQLSGASAVWQLTGKAFGGGVESHGDAVVEVELKDIRIFEEEAGKLRQVLEKDDSVNRARASGQAVAVVTKAYEAVPVITVRQRSDTKSEDWARVKGQLTKAKGELKADNSVLFRSEEPQVVAYETDEVKFIAGSFSAGDLKLELKQRLIGGQAFGLSEPSDVGAKASGGDVAFAVVASPMYTGQEFGDLPAATASAALVNEIFQVTGAKLLLPGLDPAARLTAGDLANLRTNLLNALRTSKPRAFVLYYVGHAVSGMSGAHYLVMGDYAGKLTNDLKQSSPFVPGRGPTHPLAGSNIDDIAKVVAAAGQEMATSHGGLVAVADLHRQFAETGIPFAIVVDGCYPADAMNKLRDELQFTPWGDYYGLGSGFTRELQEYQRALRTYGEAPYLRSANPVIFAAKPGTLAPVVRHPAYESDFLSGVGPLAAKFLGTYSYALENRESLSLGLWLRRITDFAGTGEMDMKGSVSWSNFDALGDVPMVTFGASQ